ncbi:MAG: hypothetical protein V6Z86_09720 [Hyphomicrobiales bacterium]
MATLPDEPGDCAVAVARNGNAFGHHDEPLAKHVDAGKTGIVDNVRSFDPFEKSKPHQHDDFVGP